MRKSNSFTLLTLLMMATCSASIVNAAEKNNPPTGATIEYESACMWAQPVDMKWHTDASYNYIQNVAFEDNKLYIDKLCGFGWAIGNLDEANLRATFKTPQQVDDNIQLVAYYLDNGEEVMLDEFAFWFDSDKYMLELEDYNGKEVILKQVRNDGYNASNLWKQVTLRVCEDVAAFPPKDGEVSQYNMNYTRLSSQETKLVDIVTKGDDVWLQSSDQGYFVGKKETNGDIRFNMPQYMGTNGAFKVFVFALKGGNGQDSFVLEAQADGSYKLNTELWAGDIYPEYQIVKEAVYNPVKEYVGKPKNPTNVMWNDEFAGCVDFNLTFEGLEGEEIPSEWMFWQAIVNGQPFTYIVNEYPMLEWFVDGETTDALPAKASIAQMFPDGNFLPWGNLGDSKFRCYIPGVSYSDKVEIRAGNSGGGSEIVWSDPIEVAAPQPNKLPDSALYSATMEFDSAEGPIGQEGLALSAHYYDENMTLSGLFGCNEKLTGTYTDNLKKEVFFNSGQILGTTEDGKDITIQAAIGNVTDPYNPYATIEFERVDQFRFAISDNGNLVKSSNSDIYLLQVIGDKDIVNVIRPGMRLEIVRDTVDIAPAEAQVKNVEMTYTNIEYQETTTYISWASVGNDVWLKFDVDCNWFNDVYSPATIYMKGTLSDEGLVFDLPQFTGVIEGKIAYLTNGAYTLFEPTQMIFTKSAEGVYESPEELWVGKGFGYSSWFAGSGWSIDTNKKYNSVETVTEDVELTFLNGKFVSTSDVEIRVLNISGMQLANEGLGSGTYIVVAGGKTHKMAVK